MSVIDMEKLLMPISAEAPAGVDVEYDPAYFALEKLARGTPEAQMGEETKPAEEPKWGEVKDAALELLGRTRDLRVALILAVGLLKTDGLAGFRDGVGLIRGLVEKMWDHFYPKLDPDDNNDPTIRVNLLKNLNGDGSSADMYKFKQRLKEATLTKSRQRIGAFGYRDLQIANGEITLPPPKEGEKAPPPPTKELVNAAFKDTATEDLQATQTAIRETLEDLAGLEASLAGKIGAGGGPDLTELTAVLSQLRGVVEEQLAKRGISGGSADAAGEAVAGGGAEMAGGTRQSISGEISSREDVVKMLDKIAEYYERYEPGSPVPIFMARAKRLVNMNFADLIKDLAPEAVEKLAVYTGEAPPA